MFLHAGAYTTGSYFMEGVLACDPGKVQVYRLRAAVNMKLADFDQAIIDCTQAIRLDPDYPKAYVWRGAAYGKLERLNEAVEDFSEAIKLDPTDPEAYKGRATALFKSGKNIEAGEDLKKAAVIEIERRYSAERSEGTEVK